MADPPAPNGIANSYPVTEITEFEGKPGQNPPYLVTNRISGNFGDKKFFTTYSNTFFLNTFRNSVKGTQKKIGPTTNGNWSPPKGYKVIKKIDYPVYEYRTYPVSVEDCLARTPSAYGKVKFGASVSEVGACHPHTFEPKRPENVWAQPPFISSSSWQYRAIVDWRGADHYEWATMEYEDIWYEYIYAPEETLEIRPKSAKIKVKEFQDYKAVLVRGDGTEEDVTKVAQWSAGTPSVAKQVRNDRYRFEGIAKGNSKITATHNGMSADAMLYVEEDPPPPEPEPEPEPLPNNPPIASIMVSPEYYWPETVEIQDNSFDADGEIISRDLRIDGQPSGYTKNFPRVTQEETHNASITVTDDDLATDSDSKSFKILPTTPKALLQISGTLKENRKVSFDAHVSDQATPATRVAPINYDLTTWSITPKSPGITMADIKIADSQDGGRRDVLFKKAGQYEVSITVTNKYGEVSEPYTTTITIVPDEKPIARFTVNQKVALRDVNNAKKATIKLVDNSQSIDDDLIKQRIWYVEYDSNNDGVFGTPMDTPKEIISSGNETTVFYENDRVGFYRFTLEVVEAFGQPTIERFIDDSDYRRDITEKIDSSDQVSTYTTEENFNIPENVTVTEISNSPPTVDFGMQTHRKVDVVLDVGGLTKATRQHKTGTRPGGTSTNDGGGRYDHYFYTYDHSEKNKVMSLAASLETDLKQKGIDARVIIEDKYYQTPDTDGEGIRDIPYWGNKAYYNYPRTTTQGDSNYSPPSPWYVVNKTKTGEVVVGSGTFKSAEEAQNYPVERDWRYCTPGEDENGDYQYSCTYVKYVYTYTLEKQEVYYQWEILYYYNQGINSTEQTDPTRLKDNFTRHFYRENSEVVYVRMDNQNWTWMNDTTEFNPIASRMRNEGIYFWNTAYNTNRMNYDRLIAAGSNIGQFSLYDVYFQGRNVQDVKDYLISKYRFQADGENLTILLGEELDYTVQYEDFEDDPELKREWKFEHDPTKVNGRTIDNQHAKIAESGYWLNAPKQLEAVGTYKIQLRSKDNPVYFNDSRFFNYQKWSDESIVREYIVNVHRRPIADFKFSIDVADNYRLDLDPSTSYDPEHQFNRDDKGIVEFEWTSYMVDGVKYDGPPPQNLQVNKIYDVTLQVKDIDGAYASRTKRISTMGMNEKPVALFDAPETVYESQELNILDLSYDPNGDPLTDYTITVRKQGDPTILKTLTDFPKSFKSMGLGKGTYVIGLRVWDIPRVPPPLQSDLFEKTIKVIPDNDPPTSVFTLTPNPLQLGLKEKATYTDSSYDINGDPLINYSWTLEKVDGNGDVIQTWNMGSPPTDFTEYGLGKYRVYQTVFDDPPSPLPSLSDTSMIEFEVIMGKQRPYALFKWTPEIVIEGNTIELDPSASFDFDGTVTKWDWSIVDPLGRTTTSNLEKPKIANAIKGDYTVTLHVWDNDNLRSELPAKQVIHVKEKPPNLVPVALFTFDPATPVFGHEISFNPDNSYDVDGEVVSWEWEFKDAAGNVTTSNQRYPKIQANSYLYQVTLKVRDNEGAISVPFTRMVQVQPELIPLVYHTPEWDEIRIKNNRPLNMFYAGEKFLIQLKTTPALSVEGKVNFGGKIGTVEIPPGAFKKVNAEGTIWETTLWHNDFQFIPEGEYVFEFLSLHDGGLGNTLTAEAVYNVIIDGNIFTPLNYHRNF
ncbi:PKD domain-containing protein [Cytobacillus firmus]|uniref:PKD domain-containing protein n=1 Tax=Cytobacillus firmus TaxID=1399 RepID=UPI00237A3F67|nr:PKD domain-containing protein [Cytobacillus firmus]MDD9309773.1 PKD domain-containing protein [Cytobacillus firmus]